MSGYTGRCSRRGMKAPTLRCCSFVHGIAVIDRWLGQLTIEPYRFSGVEAETPDTA